MSTEQILNIQLIHGDCIQLLKSIDTESIDLIVTDPPYKIISGGDSGGKNSIRPKGMLSGDRKIMKIIPKFSEWLPECFRVLKNGSHAYFMVNSSNLLELANEVVLSGFKIHNFLVWEKNNCTPSQFYMKNCEYIIFCRKGKAKWINDIGSSKTVHKFDNILGKKIHPTEKPTDLLEYYIANSSNIGDMILDPFAGSGSAGVACKKLKRSFLGIEIDADYYRIAKSNLESTNKSNNNYQKNLFE
jgi:site-specific DNA-methyltransferase (adenine-specific)